MAPKGIKTATNHLDRPRKLPQEARAADAAASLGGVFILHSG